MKRGYVDTSKGQLHYATVGDGDPVVLLHQNPRSWRVYVPMAEVLAPHYRVIALDLPGFGDSDPLPEPFKLGDITQSLYEALDGLGIDKARVFGRHTGAMVGADLAIEHPERVAALVLSGYPFLDPGKEREAHLKLARSPLGTEKGLAVMVPDVSGSHLVKAWQRASMRLWEAKGTVPHEGIPEEELDFINDLVMDMVRGRKSVPPSFEAVFSYDAHARLPLVTVPTLYMQPTGPYERDITQRGDTVKSMVPGCKKVNIENEDVYTIFWRAKEMGDIVIEFFQDPAAFNEDKLRPAHKVG